MPLAAQGHQTLSAYISSRFDEFSRSQKDVAQYVVDHLDEVAFHTAEELARRANTSSSTVVRFSQALGFEGFPELQEAAREEYRHGHRRPPRGLETAAPLFSLDTNAFEAAVAADHVNVEDTARRVSRSEVEAAIELVANSERVLIAGTDQMAFFASYLRHLLMLLDIRAEIAASPSQEALSRLGRIDAGTLVVGLSAGRPHPLVVRAMKIGRHRKAPTLAIVDATLSEVAKLSDRTLYYSSNSPAFVRSHTGLLSLLQALAYGIYSRDVVAVRRAHPRVPAQVAGGGSPGASAHGGSRLSCHGQATTSSSTRKTGGSASGAISTAWTVAGAPLRFRTSIGSSPDSVNAEPRGEPGPYVRARQCESTTVTAPACTVTITMPGW